MLMYKSRVLGVLKNNKKEENKRSPKNQDNTTPAKLYKRMSNIWIWSKGETYLHLTDFFKKIKLGSCII
jgi:hypothetical protein